MRLRLFIAFLFLILITLGSVAFFVYQGAQNQVRAYLGRGGGIGAEELVLELEAYYIKLFDSTDKDKGYNICSYSTDRTGIPLSDEHREKMRNAKSRTGSKHSKETKEKLRQAILRDPGRRIGKKHSEESKAKMREARLGTKHSEATKEKMKKTRNSEEYKHCCKHKLNIV